MFTIACCLVVGLRLALWLGKSVVCASYNTYEIECFSLDLKTDSASLPMTDA